MADLLGCPFCGGEPKAHIWENNCGDGYSGVECTACSAEVAIPLSADDDGKAELQDAIEAWNTRITPSSDAVAGGEPVARARVYMWKDRRQFSVNELGTKAAGELPVGVYDLYAAPPELDQLRDRVKELESLLQEADFWIEGALTCKSWSWDADQHEAATDSLQRIRTARRVREGGKV